MDENFVMECVENLKNEAKALNEGIRKTRERNDIGTYKNLIQAYERILTLIQRYDWQRMYSEYGVDDTKQVAIWEQNGDGLIRNHKIWEVNKKIK